MSHWRRHPDLNWGSRCCRPMPYHLAIAPYWSGLRGSNSLPPPWQGGALPDELNPHLMVSTILYARYRNLIHKECIGDRNGARTCDPLLVRQMLSQLSYAPVSYRFELYLSATIFIIHYPKPFVKSFFEISQKSLSPQTLYYRAFE